MVPEQRLLVGVCVSGESDVGVSDPGSGPRARRLQISGPVCMTNREIVFPGVQKSEGPASIQYYYVVNVRSCVRYLHCTRVLVTRDPTLGAGRRGSKTANAKDYKTTCSCTRVSTLMRSSCQYVCAAKRRRASSRQSCSIGFSATFSSVAGIEKLQTRCEVGA